MRTHYLPATWPLMPVIMLLGIFLFFCGFLNYFIILLLLFYYFFLMHHLIFDIVINNYMHITNNRSYITLKSESEYKMKYKEINNR